MKKPPTGEPYAGKPPVRFGGRGGLNPSRPLSDACLPRQLSAHDRLGGVAHGFDVLAGIEEGDDAAGTAFEALITPGEGADERAPVEHKLNVAAKILGMQE